MNRLFVTDSRFFIPKILNDNLKEENLHSKNLVFCEEKISLMLERSICESRCGSFNTDVYSFGNFLRAKKDVPNVLTVEGSSMAVRKILSTVSLKRFNRFRYNLAPTLYNLIIQLKSAGVTPQDLVGATSGVDGILKDKLTDIAEVYSRYEQFLNAENYQDQSSVLNFLPDIIERDEEIKNSDVYVVGYSSFTKQSRDVIKSLLKTAKNVTAILVSGKNKFAFVNETATAFKNICKEAGQDVQEFVIASPYCESGAIIKDNIFNPTPCKIKTHTTAVKLGTFFDEYSEVLRVGEVIKEKVLKGLRYRDVSIAVSDMPRYCEHIKSVFNMLDIPYFLDEKKIPDTNPLVSLIFSYIDVFAKNFNFSSLKSFYKNPLVNSDKDFCDDFENYLLQYNINYGYIKTPFKFPVKGDEDGTKLQRFETFRQELVEYFGKFNVLSLLNKLGVQGKLETFSNRLKEDDRAEDGAINSQIYQAVIDVLGEMKTLGVDNLSYTDFKEVFASGISAMKLSILPQYNDAVFIGEYKEISNAKAKCLFALGLTTDVPNVKEDVALISDSDINALYNVKVLIEPKIKIVNHRTREDIALGLSAFSDELYLSMPISSSDGKKNIRGEILTTASKLFTLSDFPALNGYLTEKEGLYSFSKACGDFCEGVINDFVKPSNYYKACENKAEKVLDFSNRKMAYKLAKNKDVIIKEVTSPTTIEDYFKCPYRSFITHGLKVREREKGEVNSLSVGNVMHTMLMAYVKNMYKVTDKDSSDKLFEELKSELLKLQEYERYLSDSKTAFLLQRAFQECKEFCYRTFLSFKNSTFSSDRSDVEVKFGDDEKCKYPAISLLDGKIKLSGKIDRVDRYGDYYRIIDYKTGSVDDGEKALFSGTKLQLYLYAKAVNGNTLAGVYYLPINNEYKNGENVETFMAKGKTLNDEKIIIAQDKTALGENGEFLCIKKDKDGKIKNASTKENLDAMVDYAFKVSEKAAENMADGVIVPSPYEGTCEYCPFACICNGSDVNVRTLKGVTEDVIKQSVTEEKDG